MAVIGIMDSGVGGLSVFREIHKRLPDERYIYYSDNANCPYGEKSQEFIQDRCRAITSYMLEQGAEAMVIACNTATAAAISVLRQEYDIPFIGMEPAVKPAAMSTRTGVVGVLATSGTLRAKKYQDTKGRYVANATVVEHVGRGFVELVESNDVSSEHAREVVEESLRPLLDAHADVIVLGCTHYPFLKELISDIAGPGVTVIDPAPAVARHLVEVLEAEGISKTDSNPGIKLISSGDDTTLKALSSIIFHKFVR